MRPDTSTTATTAVCNNFGYLAFVAGRAPETGNTKTLTVQRRVNDAHWSLGMVLVWITCRSEHAVINLKEGRWLPTNTAIRDLLSALRSGSLIAHGMFEGERIPHPIETAVWSTFEIVVKQAIYPGHMLSGTRVIIARRMSPPQTRLLDVTVPKANVRRLWPAAQRTAAAATRCQEHLVTEMKRATDRAPKSKADFLTDCQVRFPGLSERGFERAWANAIKQTGAVGWGKAGRRRKSSH
jgi:hypothetical protein